MSAEIREALDAIGNFRECLNDPHNFDQAMARLRAVVTEQVAEVERLRTRRGDCICDYNPETTDGPSEDCPQHGRPYLYWVECSDTARERLAAIEALHHRVPFDLMRHGITFGQTEFPDMCNVPFDGKWPCATVQLITAAPATEESTP